jgi:predicted phage baseplate assembly protein
MRTCSTCGSTALPCGCCEGSEVSTPAVIYNRPGLGSLAYRVGTHASFFNSMKARLAAPLVEEGGRALDALSTRDPGDFSIALLDGWATVADLLSFYQERIADEGYLRTATERRSVLELARLVGYTLRPGVAASVYLAYTLDDNQIEPTVIATGARAQSLPGPGESPQSFETSEDLDARREWNNLQVRMTRPQNITPASALRIDRVVVSDSVNGLRAGDPLMLLFAEDASLTALRSVRGTEGPAADGRSIIHLDPLPDQLTTLADLLIELVADLEAFLPAPDPATATVIANAQALLREVLPDPASTLPAEWVRQIYDFDSQIDDGARARLEAFQQDVDAVLEPPSPPPPAPAPAPPPAPDRFVRDLLKPRVQQARNSLLLRRGLDQAFAAGADTAPQLLVNFAPPLRDSYYRAWAGANEYVAPPDRGIATAKLIGVFVLRTSASLFGANVPKLVTVTGGNVPPQDQWNEWTLQGESSDGLYLDQLHTDITAPSYAIVRRMEASTPMTRVFVVRQATTTPRTAYGISGKSTHLKLDRSWWDARLPNDNGAGPNDMAVLRATQVWAQSVPLSLVEERLTDDVGSRPDGIGNLEIELDALHQQLQSGRWVILQGERADIEGVKGVKAAELMMVASLVHDVDKTLAGDKVHTTLKLATRSAFRYKRDTLVVYGNVVRATHGETRNELLGSGNATEAFQRFALKQPPLTFVSAATAAGADSTLAVHVDELRWHETASLAWLGPKDRGFVTRTDDEGLTHISFGDGAHGARLPTGVQNVRAVYRSGIGAPGNVRAEQISLLATRPLGVKAVTNPLRSSGGADREDRDLARSNAPLAVMALDRLVSVADYADFTRTFAGIAKARATRASDGRREFVLLTIAGVDDAPIDTSSDLYRNLQAALRKLGDADLPLRIETRELLALVLQAKVALLPDYSWEPVAATLRGTLLQRFGFAQRALGQSVMLAEVISAMQGVRGVAYVDVDAFGAIPEKRRGADGTRQLLTQDQIISTVAAALHGEQSQARRRAGLSSRLPPDVIAFPGGTERGVLRPAELAIFSSGVTDTLILNPLS